jgi:protein-disulfide isomerase
MRVRNLEANVTFFSSRFLAFATAVSLALGGAVAVAAPAKSNWLLNFTVSERGGHIVGNPNAPTKLVEYASYTCGFCAKFESNEVPGLKSQYVASGKVSFEVRNLVRDAMDLTAAMAARCGGKGRFFGNHRHLMATQATWADDSKISDATIAKLQADDLPGYLQASYTELGLDKLMASRGISAAQGKICMADAAGLKAVLDMTEEAGSLGINGTPSFMINGKVVDGYDLATLAPLFPQQ